MEWAKRRRKDSTNLVASEMSELSALLSFEPTNNLSLQENCEPFIQPEVLPVAGSDEIARPAGTIYQSNV